MEDLIYNFNRYGTMISFISNFLIEVTGIDEIYEILNKFNKEINKLKSDYLTEQYEEIGNIIENASIIYNNQLIF